MQEILISLAFLAAEVATGTLVWHLLGTLTLKGRLQGLMFLYQILAQIKCIWVQHHSIGVAVGL